MQSECLNLILDIENGLKWRPTSELDHVSYVDIIISSFVLLFITRILSVLNHPRELGSSSSIVPGKNRVITFITHVYIHIYMNGIIDFYKGAIMTPPPRGIIELI